MSIEELVDICKNERNWISQRLANIERLLDRAAYGNSKDEDELNEEYDSLEKRMNVIREVEKMIDKVNELNRMICLIEDNIDSLSCFVGNQNKIDNLYKEIDEMETQRDTLVAQIEKSLDINNKKTENYKNLK